MLSVNRSSRVGRSTEFTYEDLIYLGIIVVGCTKMILRFRNSNLKKYSTSEDRQEMKALFYTFVMSNIPTKKPFRQIEIRRKFPDLKIERADSSRVFGSLRRAGYLRKLLDDEVSKLNTRRPGHPEKYVDDGKSM